MAQMTTTPNPLHVTRRQFIGWVWAAALLIAAGEVAVAILRFLAPRVPSGAFGTQIKAGRAVDFKIGSIAYFPAGRFYLSRLDRGLLALYRKCTHLGCVVPWVEEEGRFNCPCHASIFDKKGEVLAGPAPRPLDYFRIEVKDGDVWVDTSTVLIRTKFEEAQATQV